MHTLEKNLALLALAFALLPSAPAAAQVNGVPLRSIYHVPEAGRMVGATVVPALVRLPLVRADVPTSNGFSVAWLLLGVSVIQSRSALPTICASVASAHSLILKF